MNQTTINEVEVNGVLLILLTALIFSACSSKTTPVKPRYEGARGELNKTEMRQSHDLKTWPEVFLKVIEGTKTFEIRKNDRDFKVGDMVKMSEYDPKNEKYTGRETNYFEIVYILEGGQFGLEPGFVAMQLKPVIWFKV